MEISGYYPYVLVGSITSDYVIYEDGKSRNGIPGGSLIHTAVGMSYWERHPGLISRVGRDFPESFLQLLRDHGMDTSGIKRLERPMEFRRFRSYFGGDAGKSVSFLSKYFEAGLSLPHDLLGYQCSPEDEEETMKRRDQTIVARDVPAPYLEAAAVHFCPMDFLTHDLLTPVFRQQGQKLITIQSSYRYMIPHFFEQVKDMVKSLSAFITTENELRKLFGDEKRITDTDTMCGILLDTGLESIVIQCRDRSFKAVSRKDRKPVIMPPYDTEIFNPMGEVEAFCGGFITGLRELYELIPAFVRGGVAASFNCDTRDVLSAVDALPELLDAREKRLESRLS